MEYVRENTLHYFGLPLSSQFELIDGKKVYEIVVPLALYRLTLLNAAK